MAPEAPHARDDDADRTIVLAAIAIDDEAIEAFAPGDESSEQRPDPRGLASMPLRFRPETPWWSNVATIGTGTPPTSHGVLTALAFDVDGRGAHPRRESDCDRPWVWNRFERAGRTATMCGWPALLDLREPGAPAATAPGVLSPQRLLGATTAADRDEAAREHLATAVRPPASARTLPQAILRALNDTAFEGPHTRTLRTVEAVCAAAEELERWSRRHSQERRGTTLRCLGLQLLSNPLEGEEAEDGKAAAEPIADEVADDARNLERRTHGDRLEATLDRLTRELGPGDVLLAAVIGRRHGRLFHRGLGDAAKTATAATAIDLVPTALDAAGVAVPADLPGRVLGRPRAPMQRSWDLSGWRAEDTGTVGSDSIVPVAERIARVRRVLLESSDSPNSGDESRGRLRTMLLRHFETRWALAMTDADWTSGLEATEVLIEQRGAAIDLWRRAFAAERAGERDIVSEAIAILRRDHRADLATRIAALLEPGPPSRELVESIDLADVAIPTQRSVVGRAAARLGLHDVARRALGPLIASDRCIPADRIAIANVLLSMGEAARAVAALGGLGGGPGSPGRMRILRARCLAAAGRRDDALALLDRLLTEAPFDTEARTLRERLATGG